MFKRLRDDIRKSVIIGGFRHTVESPRYHHPEAELWLQSTSARAWEWVLYDWSRWFDVHTIGPQAFYPGIRVQRPDVLAWYHKQGSERPIYLTEREPTIIGSVHVSDRAHDREVRSRAVRMPARLHGRDARARRRASNGGFCMASVSPTHDDREGVKARHWLKHHGTFLYWLRLAKSRGVDIVFDTPESNILTDEMIADEDTWPTPNPQPLRYGYDMSVDSENWLRFREDATAEHPFGDRTANG
jgi:hypothetical protein